MNLRGPVFLLQLVAAAVVSYFFADAALPFFMPKLLRAGLGGMDLNKPHDEKTPRVPEAGGLVPMVVYVMFMGLFKQTAQALIAVLSAGLLGFADNVLNLEWRWKIIVPSFTLVPLCYAYVDHHTFRFSLLGLDIALPKALTFLYITGFAGFSQNAVNIYAGINGLEVGQSLVAQAALLCYIFIKYGAEALRDAQLQIAVASSVVFLTTAVPLYKLNRYPARVFVGDVFTYYAGCAYVATAVVADCLIASGLLYFMQGLNCLISVPQLVGIVPCPRHRLPRLDEKDGKLYGKPENLNLINQYLLRVVRGGLREPVLLWHLLTIQVIGSVALLAFVATSRK